MRDGHHGTNFEVTRERRKSVDQPCIERFDVEVRIRRELSTLFCRPSVAIVTPVSLTADSRTLLLPTSNTATASGRKLLT